MAPVAERLTARKRSELVAKASSLERELDAWTADAVATRPLEKHHTQIAAATRPLAEHSRGVRRRIEELPEGAVVAGALELELEILLLHRIWDFFREKLALRYVPCFRDHLAAMDDLAWACYEPVVAVAGPAVGREPPLVFLNGGSSPFTQPRGSRLSPEPVAGEEYGAAQLDDALATLPVPVVGIPWFHAEHLPEALVIGHEIGHDVERDLGLAEPLDALIAQALAADTRADAWRAWRSEVFADIYGTLAGGPAFVATLIDFLAGEVRTIVGRRPTAPHWGAYPTKTLRVCVCCQVLVRLGFEREAEALGTRWAAEYPTHAMVCHEDASRTVADAILDGPYAVLGDASLTTLITFTEPMQRAAKTSAGRIRNGEQATPVPNVRSLLAAARLAFDADPDGYRRYGGAQSVLAGIGALRTGGVRGPDADEDEDEDEDETRAAARVTRDRVAARRLAAVVRATATRQTKGDNQHV